MKTVILLLLIVLPYFGFNQTVFTEGFDEADDATTGTDGVAATAWTTTCPGSVAVTDYFKVVSGKLEAQDTNGPAATWTTAAFDVSTCVGIQIAFLLEETSNMEECASCPGLTGTGCIDWVKLEYNLDGAGWTDVAGVTCALTESPGELIQVGDIAGGGPLDVTSPCIDFGLLLELRISCMCWAAAERWRFDEIVVSCLDCVLEVDLVDFSVIENNLGHVLSWRTLNERSNDYFIIERSYDGVYYEKIGMVKGAGNSAEPIDYSFLDQESLWNPTLYYRLKQKDIDGKITVIDEISHQLKAKPEITYGQNQLYFNTGENAAQTFHLNIYNLNGQLIHQSVETKSGSIPWNNSGFYIIEIPEHNFHQKLVIQ